MPKSRKRPQKKRRGPTPPRRVSKFPKEFEMLRYLEAHEREALKRGGHHGQPYTVEMYRAETVQLHRVGTLVKPLLEWRADWPYGETGVNSRFRRTYDLMVQMPKHGPQPDVPKETLWTLSKSSGVWVRVLDGASGWDELHAWVEAAARGGEWWTRPIGQRQKVYDFNYARRLSITENEDDARDLALGAADHPMVGYDYLSGWCAAAADEVLENPTALVCFQSFIDHLAAAQGEESFDVIAFLKESAAHPPRLPPSRDR